MNSNVVDPNEGRNGRHVGQRNGSRIRAAASPVRDRESGWTVMTPADLLCSARKHWFSVIVVAFVVTAMSCAALLVLPNRYGSEGMLYVRLGRAAVTVDPTAQNAGGAVSIQETRSAEVLSVAEMITSREIAERAVKDVGAEEILQPRSWIDRAKQSLADLFARPSEFQSEQYANQLRHEEAVERVRSWLKVNVPKNGYTIAIDCAGPDPFLVQQITQSILDQYKSYHVEAHRSDGSLQFFEGQVAESREVATTARESLQQARSEAGWTSIESAETTLRERIVAIQVSLDATLSDLAEAQQRRDSLGTQLAGTEEWIPMEVTRGVANAASDSMKTQLFDQQVVESEQLATIKPDHPRYRLLQQKMSRSQDIVDDQSIDRELRREALNPLWQQIQSELALATAKADGLKQKSESLNGRLELAKNDLLTLNKDAVRIARLKWEADIAEESLLRHARSLEEARIINELDQNKLSDVTIIQDASLNLKKTGPPRSLLAVVGACLGAALGLFQAMLRHPLASDSDARVHEVVERKAVEDSWNRIHAGHGEDAPEANGQVADSATPVLPR